MKKYTYVEIKDTLHKNKLVLITFTKIDGTARALRGTVDACFIPEDHWPKGEKKLNLSEDAVRVYDVENEGWRSFRVDSVTSIETL
jgi:WYL_2, Sm-like SH3 beta-barrel fold